MQEITIPLVGNPINRGLTTVNDQLFTNCLPIFESNPVTQSANVYVQKRHGTTTSSTTSGATITRNFIAKISGKIYEITSDSVRVIFILSPTTLGTVTTGYTIQFVDSTVIGSIEYVCFVAYDANGNSEGWYHASNAVDTFTGNRTAGSPILSGIASTTGLYSGQLISATGFTAAARILTVDSATQVTINENASSGAGTATVVTTSLLAKILDADFPTNARGGFAFLDGYAFINTATNRIYNSDLNSVTGWNASNYLTVNAEPDRGMGVYELDGTIVAFGEKNINFYKNAGNPSGSPLAYTRQNIKVGLKGSAGIGFAKKTKSGLYFIGYSEGMISAYELSAGGIVEISSPSFNGIFSSSLQSMVSEIYMFGQNGIVFAYVTSDGASGIVYSGTNYIYWPKSKIWTAFTDPAGATYTGRWDIAATRPSISSTILGGNGRRFTYTHSSPIWVDDSVAYSMIVQTSKTDFGTDDLKSVWEVALMGSDIQSSGTATLEYSDDDYTTWTTAGTFDLTKINPRINRVGSFRGGRAWRITHSANTSFRAQSLKFKFDTGVH